MSTERDSHFAGFAKLLLDEIMSNNDVWFDTADDTFREDWQKIIAQRAYDLVGHAIDHLSSYAYDVATSGQDLWDNIPDLTKWPE